MNNPDKFVAGEGDFHIVSQPRYTVSHTVDEFGNDRWNVEDENADFQSSSLR
jgi:hypothetical protein